MQRTHLAIVSVLTSLALSAIAQGAPSQLQRRPGQERPVFTDPGELPQLKGDKDQVFPLKHTHVSATLVGHVAEVEVTQTYTNPHKNPLEAIYIFPLPENSAVSAMKIVIGDRVIEAEIQKRAEARQTYETAKQQGHTAALLEQERPNVFTQSVANIEPGTDIDVVIRYTQTLTYDAGAYEFVFPMVVGPRFNPAGVTDAARISPPVLGKGMRTGHDISLELVASPGFEIQTWEAPTHDVETTTGNDGSLAVRLAQHDSLPNRDFVLRYEVAQARTQATVLAKRYEQGGFFTMLVQPPELDIEKLVGQREIIFVVDISGSMSGVPLAMCQDAMEHALGQLRPVDTFNIITFAGATGQVFESPRAANAANIKEGTDFVRKMMAGGGTYMLDAIKAALSSKVEDGRHRYVFFMTDGYVGNESQILDSTRQFVRDMKKNGQRARVFGFGVGSSVNRHLMDGLGKEGDGLTVYSTTREDPTLSVNRFFRYIDQSILENVEIDWNGLRVTDVYPKALPDLFASRPLIIHGRYDGAASSTITLRGTKNGKRTELSVPVTFTSQKADDDVLSSLWARAKIGDLSRDLWSGEAQQTVASIEKLGLDFHLVTQYTSLVAVDRSRTVNGQLQTVHQPVEVPEGVDAEMAGANIQSVGKAGYGSGGGGYGGPAGAVMREAKRSRAEMSFDGAMAQPSISAPTSPVPQKLKDWGRGDQGVAKPYELPKSAPKNEAPAAVLPDSKADDKSVARGITSLKVSGSLSDGDLRKLINNALSSLSCGTQRGTVSLRFFVSGDGKVLQLKSLSSSGLDANTLGCLKKALEKLALPKKGGTTTVELVLSL